MFTNNIQDRDFVHYKPQVLACGCGMDFENEMKREQEKRNGTYGYSKEDRKKD